MNKTFIKEGTQINMLTILNEVEPRIRADRGIRRVLLCRCDCGTIKEFLYDPIYRGKIQSCGCYQRMLASMGFNRKHGLSRTPIHNTWSCMKLRCYNKSSYAYKWYGKRGIKICKEWKNDFMKFYNWAIENGYKDGLEIDRIDNDRNYEPSNCRWSTRIEQLKNRRPYAKREK